jgi:tRNA-splicing ligase RtcB
MMELQGFERINDTAWRLPARDGMRVPAVIYASEALLQAMDDKVGEQLRNVARLPGIVQAAYAMPDAHWGYGFPIGGGRGF